LEPPNTRHLGAPHSRVHETRLILALWLVLCTALVIGGCAKKIVRRGVPFEMDAVFQVQPSSVKLSWRDKGIRLAKERSFEEAIEAFTQQVLEEPENFAGFNAIAVCYKNLGDHANAMKNFERAVEFADTPEETAKILANIGNLYLAANKPQVALGYHKEAATYFEKNPLYLIFIARTFILLNEYDRARRVLAGAEAMHKNLEKYEREDDRGLGSYLMAQCYAALNEEDKVYDHIEKALKANPERYVPRLKLDLNDSKSLLYTLKGDPRVEKALQTYAR
jgi:tetratricopeptide (TPR) repeat protein